MTGLPTRDYAIYELVENVVLSSQGIHLKQTGILEVPGGAASPNVVGTALNNERLLGAAFFNNNELVVSGQTGVSYGRVTNNAQGIYQCGHTARSWPRAERCSSPSWADVERVVDL
ncbi:MULTISPECIES: hypothetical protein [Corallococcus]|nr:MULTISPECIES: hypothetical protein [Corallococcus]